MLSIWSLTCRPRENIPAPIALHPATVVGFSTRCQNQGRWTCSYRRWAYSQRAYVTRRITRRSDALRGATGQCYHTWAFVYRPSSTYSDSLASSMTTSTSLQDSTTDPWQFFLELVEIVIRMYATLTTRGNKSGESNFWNLNGKRSIFYWRNTIPRLDWDTHLDYVLEVIR